jgi:dihydroorotase
LAKWELYWIVLRAAATSGNPKFFLGTDSAPHARSAKESACGCAGIFNAPFAIESYAAVFEQENALGKLEGFASEFGPRFYGLPLNPGQITLVREPLEVPRQLHLNDAAGTAVNLVPLHAGETLAWRIAT